MNDEFYMKKALEQARMALTAGEFPVGCVMVLGNDILATGAREGTAGTGLNEVDHAEMLALRKLSRFDQKVNMQKVSAFCTLEPCLMCFGALIISGIGRIVFAYEDAMGGGTRCDCTHLPPLYSKKKIIIKSGILRNDSLKLLKSYFSHAENNYLKDTFLAAYTLDQ